MDKFIILYKGKLIYYAGTVNTAPKDLFTSCKRELFTDRTDFEKRLYEFMEERTQPLCSTF